MVYSVGLPLFHRQLALKIAFKAPGERLHHCSHVFSLGGGRTFIDGMQVLQNLPTEIIPDKTWKSIRAILPPEAPAVTGFNIVSPVMSEGWRNLLVLFVCGFIL